MDREAARRALGVTAGTPWPEVRTCYRLLVRRHHPDVAGDPRAAATTARLTAAYRVLREAHAAGLQPEAEPAARAALATDSDDDTVLVLDAPHEDAFFALLDAAYRVGEVAYLDADAGLLEIIVELGGSPAASVVLSLQGRVTGTEVFVTVEPLGATSAPPVEEVVAALRAALAEP